MDPTLSLPLTRLLSRLESTLLSPTADPTLATSQFARNRVSINLETARSQLLTLEKQSSTVRAQLSQKQQIQADLQQKRELVKKLGAKLEELNKLDEADSDEDESEDDPENESTQPSYAPARADADNGIDAGSEAQDFLRSAAEESQAQAQSQLQSQPQQQQQADLRARKPLSASDNRNAASTTARENLFAGSGRKQHPDLETTEELMSHNRSEQDALTKGLLGLARSLKESTVNFGASLEAEKDVMKRAEGSLEKSSLGMEAAGRKMGTLRRMSEGQGWWGRVKLYGCIFGLWVFLFLVVFLGPKLRF